MGKLIDADALVNPLKLQADSFRRIGEWVRADALDDCIVEIGEQPTVDAIPVDWMLQRMNETASGAGLDVDLNNALFLVGVEWERWKKEREQTN